MTTKLLTGILIGAGAAIAIGYLLTDENSTFRKTIKKAGAGALDYLCDALDKGKDMVKEYSADAAENIKETVSQTMKEAKA